MKGAIAMILFAGLVAVSIAVADKPVPPPIAIDSAYVKKEVDRGRDRLDKQLRTTYTRDGLPINRGAVAKGFHRVAGETTLVAGVDTVSLNTSIQGGKQDISFTDATSYSGRAWSMDLANRAKVYSVLPISGSKFVVVSSSGTDTVTVKYVLEGE